MLLVRKRQHEVAQSKAWSLDTRCKAIFPTK